MSLRARTIKLMALFLALALLSACSAGAPQKSEPASTTPAPATTTTSPPAKKVLKVAIRDNMSKLDLHLTTNYADRVPLLNVLEFLVGLDESATPQPILAKSLEWSGDGKKLTLNLRQGVKFHNGQEMTSADVKYSVDRVRAQGRPRSTEFAQISDVVAKDKYTVELLLKEPTMGLLAAMANPIAPLVIIPNGEAERQGGEITKPIGTGPFKFVELVPNKHVKLEKFADYVADDRPASGFGGKRLPLVDEVIMEIIADPSVRVAALEKGDVHIADWLGYEDYKRLKDSKDVTIDFIPSAEFRDIRFGMKKGLFTNVKARQAVFYAIDRQQLVEALTWGLGKPAWAGIPYFSSYFTQTHATPVARDVNRAKQLLKDAGYDGREIEMSGLELHRDEMVLMQAMLQEIGMKTRIEVVEIAKYLQKWNAGDYEIFISGMSLRPDPMNYYMPFWHSKSTNSGYNSATYDRLNEQALAETNVDKRKQIYADLEKFTREDVPWMGTYHVMLGQGYRKNVTGYKTWSGGYLRVWNVDLK